MKKNTFILATLGVAVLLVFTLNRCKKSGGDECTPPAPPTIIGNAKVSSDDTIRLKVNKVAGLKYHWTGPKGFVSDSPWVKIATPTNDNAGQYTVTASLDGCTGSPAKINITVVTFQTVIFTDAQSHAWILYLYPEDMPSSDGGVFTWNNGKTSKLTGAGNSYDGAYNTNAIVTSQGVGGAAGACYSLNDLGHDDWYLPSRDELDKICQKKNVSSLKGFSNENYWTSTEMSKDNAFYRNFTDCSEGSSLQKLSAMKVRCIRHKPY